MKHLLAWVCLGLATMAQASEDASSFDGLVPVERAGFKRVWIDPTIDLSFYTKLLPGTSRFQFRAVRRPMPGPYASSSNTAGLPVTEADRQALSDLTDEVFSNALAGSEVFIVVDAPGEDVLIARGALLDAMSRVPPERAGGADDLYLASASEATLVLELLDSMTGEVLVRAVGGRAAHQPGANLNMIRGVASGDWAEVRRMLELWAVTLRDGLDAIQSAAP